jgi:RNA recognition motif-containing protein
VENESKFCRKFLYEQNDVSLTGYPTALSYAFEYQPQKEHVMEKLFIGNVPHTSSDAELKSWVEAHGFLAESAEIIRDRSTGQSRGFGFVVLSDAQQLKNAIAALNGQRMRNRIITVNHAVPQSVRQPLR